MSPPPQQNATDQGHNFFWLLAIILGAVILVWIFRPDWIITPVFWIRIHEIDMINWILAGWTKIANGLHLPVPSTKLLHAVKNFMVHSVPKNVKFHTFGQINVYVGHWTRWPSAVILLAMAWFMYFRHAVNKFTHFYNMKTLKKYESGNWPQITPVLSLDLVKEDPEKGPWAMAKLPLDFCKQNNLAKIEEKDGKHVWILARGPTYRIFAMQMGALWRDVEALPIHVQALAVIFVARAHHDRDVAHQLLTQISASAASGKLDFSGVGELVQKYKDSKVIKWLRRRHAYVGTLMPSLLEIARADGVLATAEFLWLKPLDRWLWYILNGVGRQTAVVEVAGVYSHWLAEKKLKRPLKTPMVKTAVNALEEDLTDTLFVHEDERWHTSNAA